jgi:hypothetical protein
VLYPTFLLKVLIDESKKRNFILKSLFFVFLYLLLSFALINYQSILSIGASEYSIFAKLKIISIIIYGTFQAVSETDAILIILSAILFGLNIELVLRKVKFLASRGSLHLTFGAGLITLVASGCASCGLSLASIVGLSAAIAILPFHGVELYFLAIAILLASLFYNLHSLVKACKIK